MLVCTTPARVLATQQREHLPRWLAAGLHVRRSFSKPFGRFDSLKQRLVRRRILNHEVGLAAEGQNDGASRLSEAIIGSTAFLICHTGAREPRVGLRGRDSYTRQDSAARIANRARDGRGALRKCQRSSEQRRDHGSEKTPTDRFAPAAKIDVGFVHHNQPANRHSSTGTARILWVIEASRMNP